MAADIVTNATKVVASAITINLARTEPALSK
jgi:hypothetical protein